MRELVSSTDMIQPLPRSTQNNTPTTTSNQDEHTPTKTKKIAKKTFPNFSDNSSNSSGSNSSSPNRITPPSKNICYSQLQMDLSLQLEVLSTEKQNPLYKQQVFLKYNTACQRGDAQCMKAVLSSPWAQENPSVRELLLRSAVRNFQAFPQIYEQVRDTAVEEEWFAATEKFFHDFELQSRAPKHSMFIAFSKLGGPCAEWTLMEAIKKDDAQLVVTLLSLTLQSTLAQQDSSFKLRLLQKAVCAFSGFPEIYYKICNLAQDSEWREVAQQVFSAFTESRNTTEDQALIEFSKLGEFFARWALSKGFESMDMQLIADLLRLDILDQETTSGALTTAFRTFKRNKILQEHITTITDFASYGEKFALWMLLKEIDTGNATILSQLLPTMEPQTILKLDNQTVICLLPLMPTETVLATFDALLFRSTAREPLLDAFFQSSQCSSDVLQRVVDCATTPRTESTGVNIDWAIKQLSTERMIDMLFTKDLSTETFVKIFDNAGEQTSIALLRLGVPQLQRSLELEQDAFIRAFCKLVAAAMYVQHPETIDFLLAHKCHNDKTETYLRIAICNTFFVYNKYDLLKEILAAKQPSVWRAQTGLFSFPVEEYLPQEQETNNMDLITHL